MCWIQPKMFFFLCVILGAGTFLGLGEWRCSWELWFCAGGQPCKPKKPPSFISMGKLLLLECAVGTPQLSVLTITT